MRLAILSDIHGNLAALEAVLADLSERAPDSLVNLGDCVTSPLWPRETMELLDVLNIPTVRGNHDRWIASARDDQLSRSERFTHESLTASQRSVLGALPPTLEPVDGVLAVHGTPASDAEYLLHEKDGARLALSPPDRVAERLAGVTASLVLCGHSHVQLVASGPDGALIVNPGSVGCPRHVDNKDWKGAEAASPHARYAIATRSNGHWSVELFVLDYDWNQVAAKARENARDDWAEVFLCGWH